MGYEGSEEQNDDLGEREEDWEWSDLAQPY